MGKKKKVGGGEGEEVEVRAQNDKVLPKKGLTREEAFEYFRKLMGNMYLRYRERCESYFEEIWSAIENLEESSQMHKIYVLADLLKSDIRRMETQYREEVEIAGITFRKGDVVEIGVGRQRYIGTFLGFDRSLYVVSVKCDDNEMVIPYKNIKYMRKLKPNEVGGYGEKKTEENI
jgi:hypothetical protein